MSHSLALHVIVCRPSWVQGERDAFLAVQLVGQVLQLPVLRDAGLAKLHQRTAQTLQTAAGAQQAEVAAPPAGGSLVHFLTQAGKYFGKDPTKWEAVGQGKVCSDGLSKTCLLVVLAALLSCTAQVQNAEDRLLLQ